MHLNEYEQEQEQEYLTKTSILPDIDVPDNNQSPVVPVGSVVILSSLKKQPGNVFVYTRTWRLPSILKITGTEHLFGVTMLSKIEILFTACDLTSNYITMMEIFHPHSAILHFKNKFIKIYISNVLKEYCQKNFKNLVKIV